MVTGGQWRAAERFNIRLSGETDVQHLSISMASELARVPSRATSVTSPRARAVASDPPPVRLCPSFVCCHSCLEEGPVDAAADQASQRRRALRVRAATADPGPAGPICQSQGPACPHGPLAQVAADSSQSHEV